MCTTCSKGPHKLDLRSILKPWKFSKYEAEFSVSRAQLWLDLTRDPSRVSCWFLNQICSPTIDLQLSSLRISLLSNVLAVPTRRSNAVRLVRVHWNAATVTDRLQNSTAACTPRVAGRLIAQATRCGRPGTAAAVHCKSHAPLPSHSLSFILRSSEAPQHSQQQHSGSAIAIDGTSSRLATLTLPQDLHCASTVTSCPRLLTGNAW